MAHSRIEEEEIMVRRIDARNGNGYDSPFKEIIDEQSIEWNLERVRERGNKPRAKYASDYGQCMLKTWHEFFPNQFEKADFDARTIRIFHNGEDVHTRLASYFHKAANVVFLEEVDVPRDHLDVHGRCDGIALKNDIFWVLEFKSINRISLTSAKEEHEGQLTWYMHMWDLLRTDLHEEFNLLPELAYTEDQLQDAVSVRGRPFKDLPLQEKMLLLSAKIKGEVIYECKPNQAIFHFPLELEQTRVAKVRNWFETLQWHIDTKRPPTVKYDKNKFPCSWRGGACAYWDVCHGSTD